MRRAIGFSTGALALSDFRGALRLLEPTSATAVELSALRDDELDPLMAALPSLGIERFEHVSIHVPSKLKILTEREVAKRLTPCIDRGIPIVVHPDVITDPSCWLVFGSLLHIENMDKRKSIGRTLSELERVFSLFPDAKWCFDLAHARQVDSTMIEARRMLQALGSRLGQIHLSEVDVRGRHQRLSLATIEASQDLAPLVAPDVPIIIESQISPDRIDAELVLVERSFSRSVSPPPVRHVSAANDSVAPTNSLLEITADHIREWSDKVAARTDLPTLIERLLLATTKARASFPGGTGTSRGGWDGIAQADQESRFCPAGISGWEVTVKDSKKKLDEDFNKRAASAREGVGEPVATYVAVTARPYGSRLKWAADKEQIGPWKTVRLLDADDLAAWLSTAPAVQAWFETKIGRPVGDYCGPDELRKRWSARMARTQNRVPSGIVLAGDARHESAAGLRSWFLSPGRAPLVVQADTAGEAALFVVEVICGEDMKQIEPRALVLETRAAWNWAARAQFDCAPILIPTFSDFDMGLAADVRAAVVVPVGRNLRSSNQGSLLVLEPIPCLPARQALVDDGWPVEDARVAIDKTGARLAALQRHCGDRQSAPWYASVTGRERETVALLLMGSWTSKRDDGQAAQHFDVDARKLEEAATWLSHAPGRPLEPRDDHWRPLRWQWSSLGDAWFVLGGLVTKSHLDAFANAVREVLGAHDPRYTMPREQRMYAALEGKVLACSKELRKGMARSMVWLAMSSEGGGEIETAGWGRDGAQLSGDLVSQLLYGDWTRWASLSDVLPDLAEAAPRAFLEALEASLENGAEGVLRLLDEEDRRTVGGCVPHVGLLWALEALAWSEDHAWPAILALARLAAGDTPADNKSGNRPEASLSQVLHPFFPQSTTTAADRIGIAEKIARDCEGVAWRLMLKGLDAWRGGSVTESYKPRTRSWMGRGCFESVSLRDGQEQLDAWVRLLIELSGQDSSRLAELLKRAHALPVSHADAVFCRLEKLAPDRAKIDPGATLWRELRSTIVRVRLSQGRSGRGISVERVEALYRSMTPDDPVMRVAWLFARFPEFPDSTTFDMRDREARAVKERPAALAALRSLPNALEILARLCRLVSDPDALADALTTAGWGPVLLKEVLAQGGAPLSAEVVSKLLISSADPVTPAMDYIASGLRDLAERGHLDLVVLTLRRLGSKIATWNLAESLPLEVGRRYWNEVPIIEEESGEGVTRAVFKLASIGRLGLALQSAGSRVDQLSPERALEFLEGFADRQEEMERDSIGGMFGYLLAKIFARADESKAEERLLHLEEKYFLVLRDGEHPPERVFAALADPTSFAEMVSARHGRNIEGEEAGSADEVAVTGDERDRIVSEGVLEAWRGFPGERAGSSEERERILSAWARDVMVEVERRGVKRAGIKEIAEVLVRAPAADDGAWPAKAARDLLDSGQYPDLSRFMIWARQNARGMVSRRLGDGGENERELERQYREWAATVRMKWPRTASFLSELAASHERDARRLDEDARYERLEHGT